jgi:hypothetical protein
MRMCTSACVLAYHCVHIACAYVNSHTQHMHAYTYSRAHAHVHLLSSTRTHTLTNQHTHTYTYALRGSLFLARAQCVCVQRAL